MSGLVKTSGARKADRVIANEMDDYIRTEAGVFPRDWVIQPLGAIAHIERGKFTARPRNDPRYFGGDIPFIQTGDVTNSNGLINDYSQTLNEAGRSVSKVFKQGTLFFTIAANIADVAFANFDAACPDSLVAISARAGVQLKWLAHELSSRKKSFEGIATHNAQLNINLEKLRPYLLPVPPLVEQQAIAEALSDADALIEGLESLIAKKRAIKQGAMQELLTGKRRLPGFKGEWEVRPAGKIGWFKGGSGFPTKFQGGRSGEYPFFKVSDMNNEGNETFMDVANNYISETARKTLGATAFPPGAIVFAKVGAAIFLERKKLLRTPSCLDNNMAGFVVGDPNVDSAYLHYFLLNYSLGSLVSTTALPSISGGVLSAIEVPLPPTKTEQTVIAAVLSDMDAELEALDDKLAKARAVKQGTMQELLTGRVRLV